MGSSCGSPLTHPALSRGLDDFFALLPGLGGCDFVLQSYLADFLLPSVTKGRSQVFKGRGQM